MEVWWGEQIEAGVGDGEGPSSAEVAWSSRAVSARLCSSLLVSATLCHSLPLSAGEPFSRPLQTAVEAQCRRTKCSPAPFARRPQPRLPPFPTGRATAFGSFEEQKVKKAHRRVVDRRPVRVSCRFAGVEIEFDNNSSTTDPPLGERRREWRGGGKLGVGREQSGERGGAGGDRAKSRVYATVGRRTAAKPQWTAPTALRRRF